MQRLEEAPPVTRTVLVVEDDESLAHLIQRVLRSEGRLTARVDSGHDAVAWLKQNHADLVLLDYGLPDMRGDELIDLFEANRFDVPFIVATGHGSETIAVEMMKRGARDYLVKGASFLDLLAPLVTRVLSQVDRERRLAHAERALRESEEQLRTVIEASNAGIWEWDLSAGLGYLSDEAYAIAGLRRGDGPVDRHAVRRFIHPDDFQNLIDRIRDAISHGKPLRTELRLLWPDGECRWVTMSAKARADAEGHSSRIAGSLLDITDRKRAEFALEARARQQAAVAELGKRALEGEGIDRLMADAVQVVAQTLGVDCARVFEPAGDDGFKAASAAFGEPAALEHIDSDSSRPALGQPALGRPVFGHRASGPEVQARLTLAHGEPVIVADYATDTRFATRRECEAVLRSGVSVLIHGAAAPFGVLGAYASRTRVFTQDDTHFLQAVANTLADAIERKRSEDDARQQQLQLAHVMRLSTMGKMVSELAHEINQPLYAIANYAAACREVLQTHAAAPPEIRVWNQHISEQANRAGEILRRLSGFVRKEPPKRVDMALGELIRKIVALVEVDARVNQAQIVLQLDPASAPVTVDRVQIEQVVVNLVVNAIEAMQQTDPNRRKVTIRSRVERTEAGPGRAHVEIEDAGPGASQRDFNHLFDAFFTTKANGMGMGLPISRSIVEAHGGELSALCNSAGGMTFRFWLPLATGGDQNGQ